MEEIMTAGIKIDRIIKDHNIKTHKELQKYLCEISGCRYYYDYPLSKRIQLEAIGILKHCELVKLEGVEMYYETVQL